MKPKPAKRKTKRDGILLWCENCNSFYSAKTSGLLAALHRQYCTAPSMVYRVTFEAGDISFGVPANRGPMHTPKKSS